jgi:signal transduction histidine kinase
VDYVSSLAQAGLAEMRALIFELRPESLGNEGIVEALRKQVAATEARFGVQIELDVCDEPDIAIELKETLYRVAQEALHNTVKHAKASHATVRLANDGAANTLELSDDGAGFDSDAEYPGHLGLRSMRERAMKAGGAMVITSSRGTGTTVRLRIPLPV